MSLFQIQPNGISGVFNLTDGYVFVQFDKDQLTEVVDFANSFNNTLPNTEAPTVQQFTLFAAERGLEPLIGTSRLTYQLTAPRPAVVAPGEPASVVEDKSTAVVADDASTEQTVVVDATEATTVTVS